MESGKGGKIVPSVVMFYESKAADKAATGCDGSVAVGEHGVSIESMSTLVGYQAIQSTCGGEMNVGDTNVDQATVKSFRSVISFNNLAEQIGVNVLIIHYFIELKHYCYCIN